MEASLKNLQNGSDIRGTALEGVEGDEVNLTPEVCIKIGKAFLTWLTEKTGKHSPSLKIAVGTDSRLSGTSLKNNLIRAFTTAGAAVIDCQIATTPAMFMSTQFQEIHADGAVMITASHLPFNKNGFKFSTTWSGLEKGDISRILEIAEGADAKDLTTDTGKVTIVDLVGIYSGFIVDLIRKATGTEKPLQGKHIIVDAGNGAGGFFAVSVLEKLGANSSGSQYLEPDGRFPNHIPNPEDEEAMAFLQRAVKKEKADLGIIFDTDVDRSAIVDPKGEPINRNKLIALMAAIVLEEHPKSWIVTDSVTSEGLANFITSQGGHHHRFKRGYRNVINESIRLNEEGKESYLAIETSGHGALKENYFLDDGAYMVAKILIKFARLAATGRTISDLISGVEEPIEAAELRLRIRAEDFKQKGQELLNKVPEYVATIDHWQLAQPNYEGHRVICAPDAGNGWFLLRMSLHEPVMPLNIESNTKGGKDLILSRLLPFLKEFSFIDLNSVSLTE